MSKLLLAATALFAAHPAVATSSQTGVHVRVADLDLTSAEGTKVLDRRIAGAADRLCPAAWNADLARRQRIEQCREAVIANAAKQRERAVAASPKRPVEVARQQ